MGSFFVQATLVEVQFPFKEKLLQEVEQLTVDSKEFYEVYNAEGKQSLVGARVFTLTVLFSNFPLI